MARYIDADKLLEELQEELEFDTPMYTKEQNEWVNRGLKIAIKDIKRIPTADVVEVVRCKDCVHCQEYMNFRMEKYLGCNSNGEIYKVSPTHFCAYGERKGGEG